MGRQFGSAGLLGFCRHGAESGRRGVKPGLVPDSLDLVPVEQVAGPLLGGSSTVADRLGTVRGGRYGRCGTDEGQ